ncbi:MAG: SUMF1/EgtB/PvdO family nonheme iron enzyme, partial [Deltaproteobacteria bacterium]|nr:SUMF1/EgtB/PvdO family nonheme iron enzyme [Deltaproteobacteria bacterium]
TEKKNPYCWIVGRFASQEEADAAAAQISAGELRIPELNYETSGGQQHNDYFRDKIFETSLYSKENPAENPNGLQVVRVRPTDRTLDSRVDKPNQPATNLRWAEALSIADFIGRKLTGRPGRLPSAAEAEFVRRGGIDPQTKQCRNFKYGTSDGNLPNESNADFARPYNKGPKDVDAVPVNPLGVRINGVWEWCNGWYKRGPRLEYRPSRPIDGSRELRGISWGSNNDRGARAANRDITEPDVCNVDIGFRAVVVAVSEDSNF